MGQALHPTVSNDTAVIVWLMLKQIDGSFSLE